MPPFGTILSSIALLVITTTSSGNHVASAFVNSSSFATKRTPPSIHQHLHIMMGKRQQQQRQNKGNKRNNKKKQSLETLLELESDLHDRGFKYVIGSDVSYSVYVYCSSYRFAHRILTILFTTGFWRSRLHSWTSCCGKLLRDAAIFFSFR